MEKQLQFISTTPEEVEASILKGVSILFDKLKEDWKPKEQTKYMTRKDVCEFLGGISLMTLWSYTKKGFLRSYSIGNRVLYKRLEVEEAVIELKPHHSKTGSTNNKKSGHDERF